MKNQIKFTLENYKELYKILNNKLEIEISKNNIQGKNSDVDLYHTIGNIFKVKYIHGKQEEFISLLKNPKTSQEDKKIIENILLFSNIPLIINVIENELKGTGKNKKKYRFENIDEGEFYSSGLIIIKDAIYSYNPDNKGNFVADVIDSKIEGEDFVIQLDTKKNKLNSIEITIGGIKKEYKINKNGEIRIKIVDIKDSNFLINIRNGKKVKFVSDKDKINDDKYIYIVVSNSNSTKFITHLNTKIKYGMQKLLLGSNGVQIPTSEYILLKKIFYGKNLYKTLVEENKMVWFEDKNKKEIKKIKEKKEDISNNPYEDYYYKNIFKKDIIKDESKDIFSSEPSDRWIALFILTQNKKFKIVQVGNVYDLIITSEKETRNKEEVYKVNFEKLIFTKKTEKIIKKTIENNNKINLYLNSFNMMSLSTSLNNEDCDNNKLEPIIASTENVDELVQKSIDMKNFFNIVFEKIENKIKKEKYNKNFLDAFNFLKESYDYETFQKKYDKTIVKTIKKLIKSTVEEIEKGIKRKYGEDSLLFLGDLIKL